MILAGAGVLLYACGLLQPIQRVPEPIGCERAVLRRPGFWLLITNCQLDLGLAASPIEPGKRPPAIYVPIRTLGATGQAPVVLRTKNPIYIATFLQLQSLKSRPEMQDWVAKHAAMVFPRRDVKGTVSKQTAQLPNFVRGPNGVAPEFALMEEGIEPKRGWGDVARSAGASLAAVGLLWYWLHRRPNKAIR